MVAVYAPGPKIDLNTYVQFGQQINLLDQKLDLKLAQNPDFLLNLSPEKKPKWIDIDEVQKIPRLLDVACRGIEESTGSA